MKRTRLNSPAGIVSAALLVIAAGLIGWLAIRATAIETLSGQAGRVSILAAGEPDASLAAALNRFSTNRGRLDPRLLPSIRAAAAQLPLDGRPYVMIGSSYLRSGQRDRAIATLEAGRRLNPRQRWIHLLLLYHYLRTGQFGIAAEEFAVLSRLVGDAQAPIAAAMAQMSVAPQTRDAVRKTLDQDPGLELSVLTAMANNNVDPATIFQVASPAGLAAANLPNGWGTVLVDRLVQNHRYAQARLIWQRINHIPTSFAEPLLYDAGLRQLPGKPPFNWRIANNNVAAVDLRDEKFNVDYYGRESGELIAQLLLLPIGNYQFSYVISGVQQGAASTLSWSITCDNAPDHSLTQIVVPPKSRPQRFVLNVSVPANCPAQWLRLNGSAGEFPTPVSAVIDHLGLARTTAQ